MSDEEERTRSVASFRRQLNRAHRQQQAPAVAGPGQVWVNTDSKIYHCPSSKFYGKTKKGEYMSESAAQAAGNRPDHGKACGA